MESHGPKGSGAVPNHEVTLSTCPFCSSGCGLLLHSRGPDLVGASPSQNHPVSAGRLCSRGWSAHEPPLWGKRLLFPTIRKGEGARRCSWEEGLEAAGNQLGALLRAGKKVGVLGSGRVTNEEAFLAVRLAREALNSPHVDSSLRSSYQALLNGLRPEGGGLDLSGILEFVEGCDLIVLLEDDLARSHPQVAFLVMRAVKRGARLVTIGPVRTQMSALARPHLFLEPAGSLEGPPELEQALGDAAEIGAAALVLAPFTSDLVRLRSTVGALAGRLERWGGEWGPRVRYLPLPVLANTRGALEMGLAPGLLPGGRPLDDPDALGRIQRAWSPELRFEKGTGAEEMLREVDGLVLLREYPPETQASPAASLRAIESLECLVTLDAFRSPAVEMASVALPLTAFSETCGTLLSLDGLIQHWRPAAPPPGEAREGWRVLKDLLSVLGVPAHYRSHSEVATEIGSVVPEFGQGRLQERGEPWEGSVPEVRIPEAEGPAPRRSAERGVAPGAEGGFRMAIAGGHAWGEDLAVGFSPTLRRDGVSERKRFPEGRLLMSRWDAERLGIREGWRVRLRSHVGEVEVPVSLNPEVAPGTLVAPFAFRDRFSGLLGGAVEGEVTLDRR